MSDIKKNTDSEHPQNQEYTFRKLRLPADSEILVAIHAIYDRENNFTRKPEEYQILIDYLSEHGDIYHPLVLFIDNQPAGYIRAYDRLSTSSCDLVLMLDLVYILPSYRGKGLGTIIMKEFLAFAAHNRSARIDLLTDLDNPAAVNLYKKCGFKGRNRFQMIRFLKDQTDLLDYFEKKCEQTGSQ